MGCVRTPRAVASVNQAADAALARELEEGAKQRRAHPQPEPAPAAAKGPSSGHDSPRF